MKNRAFFKSLLAGGLSIVMAACGQSVQNSADADFVDSVAEALVHDGQQPDGE